MSAEMQQVMGELVDEGQVVVVEEAQEMPQEELAAPVS